MKSLDFIVPGSQKAGTTSLYHYLRRHPEIFLPSSKDDPFFCVDSRYRRGWDQYAEDRFDEANQDQKWGKVTAHYLGYVSCTPGRIREMMPDVKIIVLLRNPIDRAFSHHQMHFYNGFEKRSFRQAVEDSLQDEALREGRQCTYQVEPERRTYLTWSEYGRILETYLSHFERDQLRVFYTSDLASSPSEVLREIFLHLEVNPNFTPENVGKRYHKGRDRRITGGGILSYRCKNNLIETGLKTLGNQLPILKRTAVRFLESMNDWYLSITESPDVPPELRERLRRFFSPDVQKLESVLNEQPPWPEFYSDQSH